MCPKRGGRRLFATAIALFVLPAAAAHQQARAGDPTPEDLIRAGHFKRARALVAPEIQSHPGDARLNYLMSQIADAFGDLANARALAEKAVAVAEGEARYHRQLADVDGETAETASLFAKGGWAKKFKAEAERAAALDATDVEARFDLLEYYLQAPRLMGGGKDKAAAMAEEIAKIDALQGDLAQARLAQDRKDATAEESCRLKALAARPRDYDLLIDVAHFYARPPGDHADRAAEYARRAIEADPGRAEAHSVLASALVAEARWSDLAGVLAGAQKSVPDDLDPWYRAGLAILLRPESTPADLARSEAFFRKYLTAEPEGGEPTLAHAHWRLGMVFEKEGRTADAIAELRTAVRLKPDLGPARKDLQRLE